MRKRKSAVNKKLMVMISAMISIMFLSSCESLDYTEEEEDIIANYAANLVLKHDVKYKYNYVTDLENETETTPVYNEVVENETTAGNVNHEGQGGQSGISNGGTVESISQAFELPDGIQADYVDYSVVSSYPSDNSGNNVFVMKAVENSNLLVVKFRLTNQTAQDISVNLMSNGKKYKGILNESKKYNAQLTLLLDALNTYEGVISAGESRELVLVFQTQLDSAEDVRTLSVSVVNDAGNEKVLNLK